MATPIFYICEDVLLSNGDYSKLLSTLPQNMQVKIPAYKKPADRQLRLFGKLLLKHGLYQLGFNADVLKEVSYSPTNKPVINGAEINFSISHSSAMVVCAISIGSNIGVDVEKILSVDLDLMADYFDNPTWEMILNSPDKLATFYEQWTKREAAIKAWSGGLENVELAEIVAIGERLKVKGDLFYHETKILEDGYVVSVASFEKLNEVVYQKVDLGNFDMFEL